MKGGIISWKFMEKNAKDKSEENNCVFFEGRK